MKFVRPPTEANLVISEVEKIINCREKILERNVVINDNTVVYK